QAFQDLHLLHVFQRHLLLAGDGQAVAAKAGSGVQHVAADRDVLVVADRRVVVAQRGILAGQFAERADLPVVQLLARHHGDRRRRVVQRGAAVAVEAAVARVLRRLSAHVHGGQVDGLRGIGLRGGAAGGGRAGGGKGGKQGQGEGSAGHRRRLRVADEATANRYVRENDPTLQAPYAGIDRIRFQGTLSARRFAGHPRFKNAY